MKFGKEFTSKMVHEWEEAYMNYNYLKSILKEIIRFKEANGLSPKKQKESLYRAFTGMSRRVGHLQKHDEEDDHVIHVNGVDADGRHKTMFLMLSEEGGEYELVYFRRLDDEFNKVVKFYTTKVEEVFKEAGDIDKQMDALIALRAKVEKPNKLPRQSSHSKRIHCEDSHHHIMDVMNEVEQPSSSSSESEEIEKEEEDEDVVLNQSKRRSTSSLTSNHSQVLRHVKINIQPETPWLTLKGLITDVNTKNLSFSKEEVREAEEQLKIVFIEFHQKLRLLKSYSYLNLLAFEKIMKKYDKITNRNASKAYLKMVNSSYLGHSEEVSKLMESVESTFVHHFSYEDRSKGIKALRPAPKRERHRISFASGLLAGGSIALVVALILLVQARNLFQNEESDKYMETMFPLYSLFGFVILHMLMYSANIFFWKKYRVNYQFVFAFKEGRSLQYREVFLLSAGLSLIALAGVLSNIDMEMDPSTKRYEALTELIPLVLVMVVLLIAFCPFNIIYRQSRFFFIRAIFRCISAPLYKITTLDMILADQLTSQIQAFRSLQFYICYYGWGGFRTRVNNCGSSDAFNGFYFVVAVAPYWIRMVQSIRICIDDDDMIWGYNAVKYFSTIIAVIMRTGYDLKKGKTWLILAAVSSLISGVYSTYWDLVVDWGLLEKKSKNRWLRDKLTIPYKSVYYGAIGVNVVLRFAWLQSVLGVRELPHIHKNALTAIVASLEILRRGIWNFFRIECLHLKNVGKYRAFKAVPHPFNYDEKLKQEDAERNESHLL